MIIRIERHIRDFLIVDKTPFRDDNKLSWKAKGMLAYLLCLPNNWEINRNEIAKHAKDGISALDSGLKELKECGYCKAIQIKNSDGKFFGYKYIISELPILNKPNQENQQNTPNNENLISGNLIPENQTLFNKDIIQYIKKHKKEVINILGIKIKRKTSSGIFHPNSESGELAQYFLDQIEKHNPTFSTPNLSIWEKVFNSMIFVTGIPTEEIKEVIWYSQDSSYWRVFIDNPYKFKAKYETLKIQLKEQVIKKRNKESKENIFERAKEEHRKKISK